MAGGSLKLKGAAVPKKKKKSSTQKRQRDEESITGESRENEEAAVSRSESPPYVSGKTDAQLRFDEVQRKRLMEKAAKAAAKTHKERVAEFNEKLENLSEHYDIPKVGPG